MDPTHPKTWPDRFWAGLRIFGSDFGLFLDSDRALGHIYIYIYIHTTSEPVFFVELSPPPSATSLSSLFIQWVFQTQTTKIWIYFSFNSLYSNSIMNLLFLKRSGSSCFTHLDVSIFIALPILCSFFSS